MASKKSHSAPAWQAILERVESQNRMTIEAVEVSRAVMDDHFKTLEGNLGGGIGNLETAVKSLDRDSRARDASLDLALRDLRVSVQQIGAEVHELRNRVQENSADTREVAARMGALSRLEERVATLEKRTA